MCIIFAKLEFIFVPTFKKKIFLQIILKWIVEMLNEKYLRANKNNEYTVCKSKMKKN